MFMRDISSSPLSVEAPAACVVCGLPTSNNPFRRPPQRWGHRQSQPPAGSVWHRAVGDDKGAGWRLRV